MHDDSVASVANEKSSPVGSILKVYIVLRVQMVFFIDMFFGRYETLFSFRNKYFATY